MSTRRSAAATRGRAERSGGAAHTQRSEADAAAVQCSAVQCSAVCSATRPVDSTPREYTCTHEHAHMNVNSDGRGEETSAVMLTVRRQAVIAQTSKSHRDGSTLAHHRSSAHLQPVALQHRTTSCAHACTLHSLQFPRRVALTTPQRSAMNAPGGKPEPQGGECALRQRERGVALLMQ